MNELADEQILAAMTQEHHGRITLVNVNGKPAPTTVARTFVDRIIAAHEAQRQAVQEPVAYLRPKSVPGLIPAYDWYLCQPCEVGAIPVYAAPQPAQADNDGEIADRNTANLQLLSIIDDQQAEIAALRKDAERYRKVRYFVGGRRPQDDSNGLGGFTLHHLRPVKGCDLMRGGVAGHFDDAIDAALQAQAVQP